MPAAGGKSKIGSPIRWHNKRSLPRGKRVIGVNSLPTGRKESLKILKQDLESKKRQAAEGIEE